MWMWLLFYTFSAIIIGINLLIVCICLLPPAQMLTVISVYWAAALSAQWLFIFFTSEFFKRSIYRRVNKVFSGFHRNTSGKAPGNPAHINKIISDNTIISSNNTHGSRGEFDILNEIDSESRTFKMLLENYFQMRSCGIKNLFGFRTSRKNKSI